MLDLGPAIDTLKTLSYKFRETGDHMYMMEILVLIDELESPTLIDVLEPDFFKVEA